MATVVLHDGIEFRTLDDWPGYAVSACGKVASSRRAGQQVGRTWPWRLLSLKTNSRGYKMVTLYKRGDSQETSVHRLVLLSCVGSCPAGMECRHLNGDQVDNRVENLSWGTHKENIADKYRHGTAVTPPVRRGSENGLSKLTEADIPVIRQMISDGKSQRVIAEQFGVSRGAIRRVSDGTSWGHV